MLSTYLLGGKIALLMLIQPQPEADHNPTLDGMQVSHSITYTEDELSEFGKTYTLIKKSLLRQHSVVLSSLTLKLPKVTPTKQPECLMS